MINLSHKGIIGLIVVVTAVAIGVVSVTSVTYPELEIIKQEWFEYKIETIEATDDVIVTLDDNKDPSKDKVIVPNDSNLKEIDTQDSARGRIQQENYYETLENTESCVNGFCHFIVLDDNFSITDNLQLSGEGVAVHHVVVINDGMSATTVEP